MSWIKWKGDLFRLDWIVAFQVRNEDVFVTGPFDTKKKVDYRIYSGTRPHCFIAWIMEELRSEKLIIDVDLYEDEDSE